MTALINELANWASQHASLVTLVVAVVFIANAVAAAYNLMSYLAFVGTTTIGLIIIGGFIAAVHWMTLTAVHPQSWQFAAALGSCFTGLLILSRVILFRPVRNKKPATSDEPISDYMSKTPMLANLANLPFWRRSMRQSVQPLGAMRQNSRWSSTDMRQSNE